MKKFSVLLFSIFILALCIPLITACAGRTGVIILTYTLTEDGTGYKISAGGGNYANGVLEIPETYKGKPVVEITSPGFRGATNFIAVTIPKSIKTICTEAFNNCDGLTVIMKNTEPPAQDNSFSSGVVHTGVKAIIVPNSAVATYKSAWSEFAGKIYSDSLVVNDKFLIIEGSLLSYFGDDEVVVVPATATKTGGRAFINNDFIKEITFHKNVTEINLSGFKNSVAGASPQIAKLNVALDNANYSDVNGILFDKAKKNCLYIPKKLGGDIVLPNGFIPLTFINDYNYTYHYSDEAKTSYFSDTLITSISFPQGYTNIFGNLLSNCKNLKSVTLPNDLERIGAGAFENCTSLTTLTIPASVTTIGAGAFSGCTKLKISVPFAESAKPEGWAADWNGSCTVIWSA